MIGRFQESRPLPYNQIDAVQRLSSILSKQARIANRSSKGNGKACREETHVHSIASLLNADRRSMYAASLDMLDNALVILLKSGCE